MLFNICLFMMFLISLSHFVLEQGLPLLSSVLTRSFQKTTIHVETHYTVLFGMFLFDKHSVQETVILLYVCVHNLIL